MRWIRYFFILALAASLDAQTPTGTAWVTGITIKTPSGEDSANLGASPVTETVNRWMGNKIVANVDVPITGLCRYVVAGNSQAHSMQVFSSTGTAMGSQASVLTSGVAANSWACSALPANVQLTKNQQYIIASYENTTDQHVPCWVTNYESPSVINAYNGTETAVVLYTRNEISKYRREGASTSGTSAAPSTGNQTFSTNPGNGTCAVGLYFGAPDLYIKPGVWEGDQPAPNGVRTQSYNHVFTAAGGSGSGYTWDVTSGSVPAGLILNANGTLSGTPTTASTYTYTLRVRDSQSHSATRVETQVIFNPSAGTADNRYCSPGGKWLGQTTDGPAELPRHCFNTDMAYTPSPNGVTVTVTAGQSVQTAINNANCGDIIRLQAGATFTMPTTTNAKNCDDGHWITVETAGIASLPPEGTRISPCYAGKPTLPTVRPPYPCPSTPGNYMARLNLSGSAGSGSAPGFGSNAWTLNTDHIRFIGLEITRNENVNADGAGGSTYNYMGINSSKVIFDRCWIHGNDLSIRNGTTGYWTFISAGANNFALIDSYANDFWSVSGGPGPSQPMVLYGGVGYANGGYWGNYKIVNNFLEASGHTMIFGGGPGDATVTDIEIRRNLMFKPLSWIGGGYWRGEGHSDHPSYNRATSGCYGTGAGITCDKSPQVLTLFESKNSSWVLFEANILRNVWTGFGQVGWCMEWNAASQHHNGKGNFYAETKNIVVRYDTCDNINTWGWTKYPSTAQLNNYSMHDVILSHIGWAYSRPWVATTSASQLQDWGLVNGEQVHDVNLNHVTMVWDAGSSGGIGIAGIDAWTSYNWTWKNSIVFSGDWGGLFNWGCSSTAGSVAIFGNCITNGKWGSHLIYGSSNSSIGPVGGVAANRTASPNSQAGLGFTDLAGGNYKLLSTSPGYHAADDGKDIGADVTLINTYTDNVETGLPPGVAPPVEISVTVSPSTITLASGVGQQFSATVHNSPNQSVTWTTSHGTVPGGLFSGTTGPQTVTVTATSVADPSASGTATIIVNAPPPAITVSVNPPTTNLEINQSQTFTATVSNATNPAVTWSRSPVQGSINSATGLYTAPASVPSPAEVTITATSVEDSSRSGNATATIVNPPPPPSTITVNPSEAMVEAGGTKQFTASSSATWSTTIPNASINSTGLFAAPQVNVVTVGLVHATSTQNPSVQGQAFVTITIEPPEPPGPGQPIVVTITPPTTLTLNSGNTHQFQATVQNATSNHNVTWVATQGQINSITGFYTAPNVQTQTSVTITATSVEDTSKTATATVTVNAMGAPGCTVAKRTMPQPVR